MIINANEVYDVIPFDKNELPERFEIDFYQQTSILEFNYNETGDFFTVDLYKTGDDGEDVPIVLGEKLVLGRPLWETVPRDDIPAPMLMPLDIGRKATRVSYDNMNVSVFLYIVDGGEEGNIDG